MAFSPKKNNGTPMPKNYQEVSEMEIVPDGARDIIQAEVDKALPFFNSESSQEARQAMATQAGLPLEEQIHRKAHLNFTPERKVKFLTFLAKFGLKLRAAQYAGVSYAAALNHKKSDPHFGEAWEEAFELFKESLESEAIKRAVDGWDEPVYQKGELVGTIHRHSERMLELLLKAHIPEKFRENVKLDAAISGGVLVVPAPISADDWEKQYGGGATLPKTIEGKAE